jgi:transcriptional regulator with PAS, ATPase and Fis domain
MPYTVDWLVKNHVILLVAEGNFTIEEYEEFSQRVVDEFLHSIDDSVYIIAEFSKVTQHSSNINRISKATNQFMRGGHRTAAVVVTQSRLMGFIASTVTKLGGAEVYIAATYSDALKSLERLNPNLNLP